jgi:hypothetical protein
MRVRFVKSFRAYRKGAVAELGDGEANVLIARGIVQRDQPGLFVESATMEHETRTAAIKPRRRKRVAE